ncbi:MAG: MATE family efflux transporter [Tissierellia bacterium]|nr:MATE family efflux transporter [Tissierellia bacterium]
MQTRRVDLLEGDILKKLIILAAPLMATAFVQMTYNFVDIIWLGKLGTGEVAAVGASGIIVWLSTSFVAVSRVGGNVFAAQYYGAKNKEGLDNAIKNSLFLVFSYSILFMLIVMALANYIIGFFGLDQDVTRVGANYLRVISVGLIFQFINQQTSTLYNSMGNSFSPFKINSIGLVTNLILDPLLIFGLGPFPQMGVFGAALATSFSQLVVLLIFVFDSKKHNGEILAALSNGRINRHSLSEIVKMGAPAGLQNAIMASIALFLNRFVASYGKTPMAVYTIGTNIESITWMTVEGFQAGIIAFVGQNYGARQMSRLKEIIRKSMLVVGIIGVISTAILIGFRHELFKIFLPNNDEAIAIGAVFLLILGASQFFMAVENGSAGVFHGLGLTKIPSKISISFNLIRIPMALFLMGYFGFYGVWISVTISTILKGSISAYILSKKYTYLG